MYSGRRPPLAARTRQSLFIENAQKLDIKLRTRLTFPIHGHKNTGESKPFADKARPPTDIDTYAKKILQLPDEVPDIPSAPLLDNSPKYATSQAMAQRQLALAPTAKHPNRANSTLRPERQTLPTPSMTKWQWRKRSDGLMYSPDGPQRLLNTMNCSAIAKTNQSLMRSPPPTNESSAWELNENPRTSAADTKNLS